jgi:nucleoside-diphosphate-sugar epimerase
MFLNMNNVEVLVTGSSGYVASDFIRRLKLKSRIICVDQAPSEHTDVEASSENSR